MANVRFSRKTFEKEIGNLTEEMQQKIALFGTTIENLDNETLELDVTPNRPDLLSYQGFKRGFLGFLGKKTGLTKYKINPGEKNFEVKVDSSVKEVRPYTCCSVVKGIKFDDFKIKEIVELQEKLHSTIGRKRKKLAIGIYPMEEIKFPIEYKALEPDKIKFIPLESKREMSGLEILQIHPAGKEYANLLAGKMKFPIFLDANKNILSMPPIINSEKTGRVSEKTKDVFVECSGFDLEILNKCLIIITTTLADMGGKIYSMKVGNKIFPDFSTEKMKISLENTNRVLGLNLNEKELKMYLEKMGHNYNSSIIEIAPWRTDILHEIDLVEDVAISYGYNNFNSIIPEIATIGKESYKEIIKRKISEVLIGLGFLEVSNYHLTKKEDQFLKMGVQEKKEKGFVEIIDSKTEYSILRTDLSHYLLKLFSENIDAEYPQKIFELGKVFNLNSELNVEEFEKLSIGFSPGNFTSVKQVLDYLEDQINFKFEIKPQEICESYFVEGRSADIYFEGEIIGNIGEIHPKILKNWKIKMPVSILEINLEKIFKFFK